MTPQIAAAALVAECGCSRRRPASSPFPRRGTKRTSSRWHDRRLEGGADSRQRGAHRAVELLAAAQGLEFLKPLKPGQGVGRTYSAVRKGGCAARRHRPFTADIEQIASGVRVGRSTPRRHERRSGRPRAARYGEVVPRLDSGSGAPDAHEQPRSGGGGAAQDLVVYGAPARRRATGLRSTRSAAPCSHSRTTRPCWCNRESQWACSRLTRRLLGCFIANANLVGRWATWEVFRELERQA